MMLRSTVPRVMPYQQPEARDSGGATVPADLRGAGSVTDEQFLQQLVGQTAGATTVKSSAARRGQGDVVGLRS